MNIFLNSIFLIDCTSGPRQCNSNSVSVYLLLTNGPTPILILIPLMLQLQSFDGGKE